MPEKKIEAILRIDPKKPTVPESFGWTGKRFRNLCVSLYRRLKNPLFDSKSVMLQDYYLDHYDEFATPNDFFMLGFTFCAAIEESRKMEEQKFSQPNNVVNVASSPGDRDRIQAILDRKLAEAQEEIEELTGATVMIDSTKLSPVQKKKVIN